MRGGKIKFTGSALLVISGLLIGTASSSTGKEMALSDFGEAAEPVSRMDIMRWLGAAGIDPESLTAAGLEPGQVGVLIESAKAYLAENLISLNQLQVAAASAAAKAAKPEGESPSPSELQALAATAKAARDTAVDSFFDAATENVASDIKSSLRNIRLNRTYGLPVKYLVVIRTPADWAALRNAIAVSDDAERRGETVPSDARQILDTANTDPAVAAASVRLASNLASTRSNWTTALANL